MEEAKPSSNDEDPCAADEEENVVTIKEYVEGLEEQELEADMILGGDDGKECTYLKGYLPRQAVFSCITCCPDGNAGVCTACSMTCHDGHEVIEIWTRRHFRCDCGNSKFGVGICKLFSGKDSENPENLYNQNFTGVYCTCKRPYPDPDCTIDVGEMLQCCICEDWFHEAHLGLTPEEEIPRDDEGDPLFEELICQSCSNNLDFLSSYGQLLVSNAITSSVSKDGDVTGDNCGRPDNVDSNTVAMHDCQTYSASLAKETDGDSNDNCTSSGRSVKSMDAKGASLHAVVADANQDRSSCKLKSEESLKSTAMSCEIPENNEDAQIGKTKPWSGRPLFLRRNWRSELCQCIACCAMYGKKGVSFLTDCNDTLVKYEENAKQKRKETMEAANGRDLSFLNGLSHEGQIEFLHGLNEMTTELSAFFASCESGKTITSADIYEFFDNLKRKRARLTE